MYCVAATSAPTSIAPFDTSAVPTSIAPTDVAPKSITTVGIIRLEMATAEREMRAVSSFVAIVAGVSFLHEPFSAAQTAGVTLILLGVYVANAKA